MSCSTCKYFRLPACAGLIAITAGLTAATEYKTVIEDQFGNLYSRDYTTDGDGKLILNADDYPEGKFSEHSGIFTLTIVDKDFTFETVTYSCVQFSFHNIDGELEAEIK